MKPMRISGGTVGPEGGEDEGKQWSDVWNQDQGTYGLPSVRDKQPKTLAEWLGVPWWFWLVAGYALYKSNKSRK